MFFRLKNIKLTLITFFFFSLCIALGVWQSFRGHEKSTLIHSFKERSKQPPLTKNQLFTAKDVQFYRIAIKGTFDNEHTFLLDNKIYKGQVGYEIYTPFKVENSKAFILIDRGFIRLGQNRQTLPVIRTISQKTLVSGIIMPSPHYIKMGPMIDSQNKHRPYRFEYLDLSELSLLLKQPIFPFIIVLAPNDPAAYPTTWQITTVSPERHYAYALQWFALALTLLLSLWAFNRVDL